MCRMIAVIPSLVSQGDILDILQDMQGQNKDGFGYGYVKDGEFISKKTTLALEEVLKRKSHANFFGETFKHNSWVLFHMRKASRGAICLNNSHPFVSKDNIFCHNGTFEISPLIKDLLGKDVKYNSSTDSEVAMKLYEKVGIIKFSQYIKDAGVFLSLKKNGYLHAIKTNFVGDLKIVKNVKTKDNKVFLSSEMPYAQKDVFDDDEMSPGYLILNPEGVIVKQFKKETTFGKTTYNYPSKSCCSIENHNNYNEIDLEVKSNKFHSMSPGEYAEWNNGRTAWND